MSDCNAPGEQHLTFDAPAGYQFSLVPESNGSVSINMHMPGGNYIRVWNAVDWGICTLVGTATTLAVTTFTGNPVVGAFAGAFATWSCTQRPPSYTSEDGDQYIQGCY